MVAVLRIKVSVQDEVERKGRREKGKGKNRSHFKVQKIARKLIPSRELERC